MKTYSLKARNKLEWVSLYILILFLFVILLTLLAINTLIKELYEKGEISVRIENLSKERIAEILKVRDKIEKSLKGKIQMTNVDDNIAIRIYFTGVMSKTTKEDLLKKLPELSKDKSFKEAIEVICNFRDYMRQFWITIKYSNFNTLYLARGFIAFNNAFFLLPLIFFSILIFLFKTKEDDLLSNKREINLKWCYILFSIFMFLIILTVLFIIGIIEIPLKNITIIVVFYFFLCFYISSYVLTVFKFKSSFRRRFYISHRYFLMYIYLRHPVAFPIGLFYNLIIYLYLCHSIANPDQLNMHLRLPALAFFAIWSTSLAMWMGPFIRACLQIFSKDFIDEYYRKTLHMCISDLDLKGKKHRVLLGFGRLGQGVHKELLERRTNKVSIEPLINPSDGSSIRYLRKDMVIVDRDEKIFDHVFVDPSFEKIGVAKVNYRDIKPEGIRCFTFSEEELWVPAIIGDITNESVLDYSNLGKCEFFIDTVKGYEETLKIARFAHDNRELKGIITVSDSAQKELLFPRYSGHGIFFTYVKHQQGISLGETVYPAMLRWLKQDGNSRLPNILVLTDDIRQIHYMIETIVQEFKLGGFIAEDSTARTRKYNTRQYDLEITICGNSKEIKSACHPRDPQERREPNFSLDERRWNVSIERCSNPDPEHANPPHPIYISSRIILEHPHLTTMEKMIRFYDIKPDIVVISFREASRVLKTLRDWVGVVQRNPFLYDGEQKYKPVIIVGSLGEEQREVRDVLFYYDALYSQETNPTANAEQERVRSMYPVQAIDCRVDLYKDSREHIGAIADALSENDEQISDALGIHMMVQNKSGTTPEILAALGGVKPKNQRVESKQPWPLSFHYCRYYNCVFGAKQQQQGNNFFFESDVTLETVQNKDKTPSPPNNNDNNSDLIQSILLSVRTTEGQDRNEQYKPESVTNIEDLFEYYSFDSVKFGNLSKTFNKEDKEEEFINISEKINACQFQATCGPDSFRREIFNLFKHKGFFENISGNNLQRELNRYYFNKDFPDLESEKITLPCNKSHAKLYLCCKHGDTPGALAIALNRFLGKIYIPDPYLGNRNLFNITFLINYFTFNPKVVYEAIYGNLVNLNGCRNKLNEGVIERILICPISDSDKWYNYANELRTSLGEYKYNIWPKSNDSNNKNNILIHRKDCEPCKICKEPEKEIKPDAGCDICRKYWYGKSKNWWPL